MHILPPCRGKTICPSTTIHRTTPMRKALGHCTWAPTVPAAWDGCRRDRTGTYVPEEYAQHAGRDHCAATPGEEPADGTPLRPSDTKTAG
eukprot:9497903-Pyramimonas_sp.AAC.1